MTRLLESIRSHSSASSNSASRCKGGASRASRSSSLADADTPLQPRTPLRSSRTRR